MNELANTVHTTTVALRIAAERLAILENRLRHGCDGAVDVTKALDALTLAHECESALLPVLLEREALQRASKDCNMCGRCQAGKCERAL